MLLWCIEAKCWVITLESDQSEAHVGQEQWEIAPCIELVGYMKLFHHVQQLLQPKEAQEEDEEVPVPAGPQPKELKGEDQEAKQVHEDQIALWATEEKQETY